MRRNHHERKEEHITDQHRKQRLRKRHRQTLLLDPPVRGDAENEIQTGCRHECMRRRDTQDPGIEQQRRRKQHGAAACAVDIDDPQYPPRRFGDRGRQRRGLERRYRGARLLQSAPHHGSLVLLSRRCHVAVRTRRRRNGSPSAKATRPLWEGKRRIRRSGPLFPSPSFAPTQARGDPPCAAPFRR